MRVLIACEESQAVSLEFRKLGHEAYSCDLVECGGGHDLMHLNVDALQMLKLKWDLVIAHPPCTYLTVTGNRWFNEERYGDKARERKRLRGKAAEFFMAFADCRCPRVAIENPVGYMSTVYRKPDQIIQPYEFGDPERKATCLWLRGLPPLVPTDVVEPEIIKYKNGRGTDSRWHMETMKLPPAERAKMRSRTFPGIAKAMASQWCEAIGMEGV